MAKFYRRTDVSSHATTFLDSNVLYNYSDVFDGTTATSDIVGNAKGNWYITNAPIAELPTFGDSELIGLEGNFWVNSVTPSNSFTTPSFNIYKINKNIAAEGTVNIGTKDIVCFSSNAELSTPLIAENFGNVTVSAETTELVSSSKVLYSGMFLYPEEAHKCLTAGTSGIALSELTDTDRYATELDDGTLIVAIEPTTLFGSTLLNNEDGGLQMFQPKNGRDTWDPYEPSWRWGTIKDKVKYEHITVLEEVSLEDENIITEDTTIFSVLKYSNSREADTTAGNVSGLLLDGKCTFSSEKVSVGANSMKMNCHWDSGEEGNVYGGTGIADSTVFSGAYYQSQYCAASTQIPIPVPVDLSMQGRKQIVVLSQSDGSGIEVADFTAGEYFVLYAPAGFTSDSNSDFYNKFVFWSEVGGSGSAPSLSGCEDIIQVTSTGSEGVAALRTLINTAINTDANYSNMGFSPFTSVNSSGILTVTCNEAGYVPGPNASIENSGRALSGTSNIYGKTTSTGKDWWSGVVPEISCDVFFDKLETASVPSAPTADGEGDIKDANDDDSTSGDHTWWNNHNNERSFAITFGPSSPKDRQSMNHYYAENCTNTSQVPYFGIHFVTIHSKTTSFSADTPSWNEHIRPVVQTSKNTWNPSRQDADPGPTHYFSGYATKPMPKPTDDDSYSMKLESGKWYKFRFLLPGHQHDEGRGRRYTQSDSTIQDLEYMLLVIEQSDGEIVGKIKLPNNIQKHHKVNSSHWQYNTGHGTGSQFGQVGEPSWPSWLTFWLNNSRGTK